MRLDERASAEEVVRELVLAEIDSPRSSRHYAGICLDRDTAAAPLDDEAACARRAEWLRQARGWPDERLFCRLPADTAWWWVELDGTEAILCMWYDYFPVVTGPDRLPRDFAGDDAAVFTRIGRLRDTYQSAAVEKIGQYLCIVNASREHALTIAEPGRIVPPCIYVAREESGPLVILDGHARAVARSMFVPRPPERALLGVSPRMGDWKWFGP
jgi:hypothetical protein